MNILYCGDKNIEDGLVISVLSLIKNVKEPLNIYVLTMNLVLENKKYFEVSDKIIEVLDTRVKNTNSESFVKKIDISELFERCRPTANMETRFTPYCMLRLYADQVEELPDRVLYLDNDVVCRKDCSEFYNQNMENTELVGVLDHYGKWFFKNHLLKRDYINSGVLLLNLEEIRKTGLFKYCRKMCQEKEMFMPDQSAINKLSKTKRILGRKYNDQRKLHKDTIFQHFTTSFRFWPWLHTITIKPWNVDMVHEKLKIREYDDILKEYVSIKGIELVKERK